MQNPTFKAILDEMLDLHDRKNADYAGDTNPYQNFEIGSAAAGVSVPRAILVQAGNKIARLANLLDSEGDPDNEPIEDSWMDLAVYAVIALAWTRDRAKEPSIKVGDGRTYLSAEGGWCGPEDHHYGILTIDPNLRDDEGKFERDLRDAMNRPLADLAGTPCIHWGKPNE